MACIVNPSVSTAGSSSSSVSGLSAPSRSSSCLSLSVFTPHRTQHAHRTLIMCAPPQATTVSLRTSRAQVDVLALKAKTRPEMDPLRLWERYLEWIYQHKDFGLYMDVSRIGSLINLLQKWRRKWLSSKGAQFPTQRRSEWFGITGYASPSLPRSPLKSNLKMHLTELACLQLMLLVVPHSILQQSWAKRICSGQKCLRKSVKSDASALTIVQVAFNDLVKHAQRFHLYFKNLQSQLWEPEIFKSSAAHDWLKLICLLHQNLKRKSVIVILGSVMAGMLIMVGAPIISPNPVTWALTEENLIFLEAWRTIDRAYIDKTFNGQSWFRYREEALRREPMNNREQTYAAIRKMLMTLEDPFTRFLEPEKFKTLRTGTRGAVTGVGLEVGFESNGANADLVVIAPVIGGPAERVGIVPGDIISEIDGMSTNGLGLYEAAQRLQGPESSEVKLTVQKKQSGSSNNIVLVREKIKINPVSWRLCEVLEEGKKTVQIGYIRLATFNENASRSIKEAIQKLKESGATAYILDMRNNSGGLFPAGIEIAKMWLEKGVIVYITDSKGIRDIYEADGYGTIATDEPLAVLVNKGTASASEILAGALKDNKRATILGEPTFGKGKIQSVFELSDGSGMAVTVARYETPAHVDIDKVGITPDHSLPASAPLDKEDFCRCLIDPSLPCYMPPSTFFPS